MMKNFFHWIFRILILLPFCYWAYLLSVGDLGADPAKTLNHKLGEFGLYLILLNLMIGVGVAFSLQKRAAFRFFVLQRRYLGLISFSYLVFHVLLYLVMEGFESQAYTQILTKRYLNFGAVAWILIFVLAVTSNDFALRKLKGKRWKNLHRLVYLAMFLVGAHVLLIEKTDLVKYGAIFFSIAIIEGFRFIRFLIARSQRYSSPQTR